MLKPCETADRIKVLYIAGAGRSGGTILCHILGQQPGWFYAGELRDLWTSGLRSEKLCGCGRRVVDCEVWQAVFERAYGGLDKIDTAEMTGLREGLSRTRHWPSALLLSAGRRPDRRQRVYLERLAALYSAIRDVTGCQVIVDASRLIPYGLYVSALSGVDFRVVHLVRDPRAVVFSWKRRRTTRSATKEHTLPTQGTVRAAMDWAAQNAGGDFIWKSAARATVSIRYEDTVDDPAAELGRVVASVDAGPLAVPFIAPRIVDLRPTHSVAGNAYRSQSGLVTLAQDNEWRTSLGRWAKLATTLLCLPGMLRYRYPLRSAP